MQLILASSSFSRRAILKNIHLNFTSFSPDIDETPFEKEEPIAYTSRLSLQKAQAIEKKLRSSSSNLNAIIIGSDQTASLEGRLYEKPLNEQEARSFLSDFSQKELQYTCAITLVNTQSQQIETDYSISRIRFKKMTKNLVDFYLKTANYTQCASGIQIETTGPLLIESFETHDPTGILGFPILLFDKLMQKQHLNLFDFCYQEDVS